MTKHPEIAERMMRVVGELRERAARAERVRFGASDADYAIDLARADVLREVASVIAVEFDLEATPVPSSPPASEKTPALPRTRTANIKIWQGDRKNCRLVCCYCDGPIGRGKLDVDGWAAHKSCHVEACR